MGVNIEAVTPDDGGAGEEQLNGVEVTDQSDSHQVDVKDSLVTGKVYIMQRVGSRALQGPGLDADVGTSFDRVMPALPRVLGLGRVVIHRY